MKEWIVQYWVEVIFGATTTILGVLVKKMAKKINEQEAIKMGVQALLRDRIIQAYNVYMEKGFCPIYARENINAMSEEYFNLGGNGVIHDLLNKLIELPTSLDEKELLI